MSSLVVYLFTGVDDETKKHFSEQKGAGFTVIKLVMWNDERFHLFRGSSLEDFHKFMYLLYKSDFHSSFLTVTLLTTQFS